jgi:hypothetical protein
MYWTHFTNLDTNPGIMLHVAQEMPLVVSRMEIELIASLIHINQRDDVRPAVHIHRTYMSDFLCPQELVNLLSTHHSF